MSDKKLAIQDVNWARSAALGCIKTLLVEIITAQDPEADSDDIAKTAQKAALGVEADVLNSMSDQLLQQLNIHRQEN